MPLLDIRDVPELTADDVAFLDELSRIVQERGMDDRFGFQLVHGHHGLGDDEVFVERPGEGDRKMVLLPEPRSSASGRPTGWMFDRNTGQLQVTQMCAQCD